MRRIIPLSLAVLLSLPVFSSAVTRNLPKVHGDTGVTLKLTEPTGSIYRPGESVRFSFTSKTDAYVIIYDLDADGYVHLLYPEEGKLTVKARAGREYTLPEENDAGFIVTGPAGMEFVFALAVPGRDAINDEELVFLADNETLPDKKKFRIDGDPLLAANMIASQLVRDISHLEGVSLAYTYFYINEQVDYPRYLCAECHDKKKEPYKETCAAYEFASNFDNTSSLAYPLGRGFEISQAADEENDDEDVTSEEAEEGTQTKVYISFYPYNAYVYTPPSLIAYYAYDPWYWTPLWYDPWWCWGPYYPSYSGFSFYFGWGWGWGYSAWGWDYWSPYVSWWYPYDYYPSRFSRRWARGSYRPSRYKYKHPLYVAANLNARKDPSLRISSVLYKDRKLVSRNRIYKKSSKRYTYSRTALRKKGYNRFYRESYLNHIKRNKSHLHNSRTRSIISRRYISRGRTELNNRTGRHLYKPQSKGKSSRGYIKKPSKSRRVYRPSARSKASSPKVRGESRRYRSTPSKKTSSSSRTIRSKSSRSSHSVHQRSRSSSTRGSSKRKPRR